MSGSAGSVARHCAPLSDRNRSTAHAPSPSSTRTIPSPVAAYSRITAPVLEQPEVSSELSTGYTEARSAHASEKKHRLTIIARARLLTSPVEAVTASDYEPRAAPDATWRRSRTRRTFGACRCGAVPAWTNLLFAGRFDSFRGDLYPRRHRGRAM